MPRLMSSLFPGTVPLLRKRKNGVQITSTSTTNHSPPQREKSLEMLTSTDQHPLRRTTETENENDIEYGSPGHTDATIFSRVFLPRDDNL